MKEYLCRRCLHKWIPRIGRPKYCPRCKSPYWNKERKSEVEDKPVTLAEVRDLVINKDWSGLRDAHTRMKTYGMADFKDEDKLVTFRYMVFMSAMYRQPMSILAAIAALERGVHPYDDPVFRRTAERDALKTEMELRAITGK